jgi:peptidyl-prolyl cis-trans isomerase SurA
MDAGARFFQGLAALDRFGRGRTLNPEMKVLRLVLLGALFLPAWHVRAELATGIKAVVHDSVITYEDVEALTDQTADVLKQQFATRPEMFQKKMDEARGENLDKFVARELILHEFKTAGYSLPDSVIDELVNERIKAVFGDRRKATKTLQARGLTFEKFREQERERFIVEAMRAKNVSQEIIISPHKIETYYAGHQDDFKVEDEVKLRMIVLNKPRDGSGAQVVKRAEEILAKVNRGEATFSDMASLYSEGSQRKEGGDWGWVEKSVLRKELADVAFALKPGERSGVIDTPEACYLMLVEDTKTAHVKPINDVRDQIEKLLQIDERKRIEKQWIDKLKKKTFVRYF